MVCDGPDPPENAPNDMTPPLRHDLVNGNNHDESDDEQTEYFGYEPLPQGPDGAIMDFNDSEDEIENTEEQQVPIHVPNIEPVENTLVREVWSTPRAADPIQMDNERVQQVMSAMANFALPEASIPEWAQSISEDQWKQTLNDRLERLRSNR